MKQPWKSWLVSDTKSLTVGNRLILNAPASGPAPREVQSSDTDRRSLPFLRHIGQYRSARPRPAQFAARDSSSRPSALPGLAYTSWERCPWCGPITCSLEIQSVTSRKFNRGRARHTIDCPRFTAVVVADSRRSSSARGIHVAPPFQCAPYAPSAEC